MQIYCLDWAVWVGDTMIYMVEASVANDDKHYEYDGVPDFVLLSSDQYWYRG